MRRPRPDIAPITHKPFGPAPIPSITHSYDDTRPASFLYGGSWVSWLDVWMMRGGSLYRDTIHNLRAKDYPDLRSFNEQIEFARLEVQLSVHRGALRRRWLAGEMKAAKGHSVSLRMVK